MATTDNPQSESTTDMDKVISRIQKILSRTNTTSGTTEAEADTALKMAQELALKHNLDLAAIEASATASNASAPVERVKDELKGRAMYKWQRQLAKYVAEANFCYHIAQERSEWMEPRYELCDEFKDSPDAKGLKAKITRSERDELATWTLKDMYRRVTDGSYKKTHKHIFVGRKGNVITAQMMFQYLTQTIEDLVVVEMGLTNAQRLSRSAMSWKEGASDRLCERLAARRQDLIEKHDARVKQEEADRQESARKAREDHAAAKQTKGLPAHHESEVKTAFEGIASEAYEADAPEEPEGAERPDMDEEPWTPEGDEVQMPDAGTAMVLASVFDKNEMDANYELAHGLEQGTLAKWRAEREEARRKAAEEQATEELVETEAPVKEETARQRGARIRREEAEHEKNRRRWAREDAAAARREAKEWAKRDHRAYRKGAEKGKEIGIDAQVKAGKDTKKLS